MATPVNGSVELGFKIIRQVAAQGSHARTLTEIARHMNLPVPTVHRFLKTLVHVGALARLPRGRYSLGAPLADLGGVVPYEALLRMASQRVSRALACELAATVHVAVLETGMAKFIVKESGDSAFSVDTMLGGRFEAYCTASGKVLLAGLKQDELDDYLLGGHFIPFTSRTIADRAAIRDEIHRVKTDGFASDQEEFQIGVACWAMPIANSIGRTVASLSASFPNDRGRQPAKPLVIAAMKSASRAITNDLCASMSAYNPDQTMLS